MSEKQAISQNSPKKPVRRILHITYRPSKPSEEAARAAGVPESDVQRARREVQEGWNGRTGEQIARETLANMEAGKKPALKKKPSLDDVAARTLAKISKDIRK